MSKFVSFKIFGGQFFFLRGHWYSFFGLLVMSPLDFKARVGSLVCSWWRHKRHTWCTFSTSWQPTWQPSWSFPHTCGQVLVGLKTGTYHATDERSICHGCHFTFTFVPGCTNKLRLVFYLDCFYYNSEYSISLDKWRQKLRCRFGYTMRWHFININPKKYLIVSNLGNPAIILCKEVEITPTWGSASEYPLNLKKYDVVSSKVKLVPVNLRRNLVFIWVRWNHDVISIWRHNTDHTQFGANTPNTAGKALKWLVAYWLNYTDSAVSCLN